GLSGAVITATTVWPFSTKVCNVGTAKSGVPINMMRSGLVIFLLYQESGSKYQVLIIKYSEIILLPDTCYQNSIQNQDKADTFCGFLYSVLRRVPRFFLFQIRSFRLQFVCEADQCRRVWSGSC